MKNSIVFLISLFVFLVGGYYILQPNNILFHDKKAIHKIKNTKDKFFISDINNTLRKFDFDEKEMKLLDDSALLRIENNNNIITNLFQEVDIDSIDTIKKKKDIEPIGAVLIEKNKISSVQVGDTIELPLMGSSNYQVKITGKILNPSGSVSVSGNLVEDDKYSAVLTQSDKSAYGSITTPEGAYEIETVGGKGYIYSVKDIEKKRVDHTHSDALDIPNE